MDYIRNGIAIIFVVFMCVDWTTIGGLYHELECNYQVSGVPNEGAEEYPNKNGFIHDLRLDINENYNTVCYLNVNKLRTTLINITAPDYIDGAMNGTPVFYITYYCENILTIVFYSEFENQLKLSVFLIFGDSCSYNVSSLTHVQAAFSIVSFGDGSGSLLREPIENCTWFDDTRVFMLDTEFTHIEPTDLPFNISYFLDCITVLDKVQTLVMYHIFSSTLPFSDYLPIIQEKFPNVLRLGLLNNALTTPPQFPWGQHKLIAYVTDASYNSTTPELKLNNNNITNLSAFQFSRGIGILWLTGNQLYDVSNSTFQLLDTLQELDLSDNNLTSLPPGALSNLVLLTRLKISHNQIVSLNGKLFQNLRSLKYLDLAYNRISSLPKELLDNLMELSELYLDHNNLHSIPNELLKPPLRFLYINRNPLDVIPTNIFYMVSLEYVSLQHTGISEQHLYRLQQELDILLIKSVFRDVTFDHDMNSLRATVDMSFCQIHYVPVDMSSASMDSQLALYTLITYFNLKLDSNPIDCACSMAAFLTFIKAVSSSTDLNTPAVKYIYKEWKCASPHQLNGRLIGSVLPGDMYCPITISSCPSMCYCYKRLYEESIIVDCRGANITSLPETLPPFKLELWFQGSSVANITSRPYLENITYLDLYANTISYIARDVFERTSRLQWLLLHQNVLSHLPESITLLNSTIITLSENPYLCDCEMKWMKDWLIKNEQRIRDVYQVKCIHEKEGQQLILVPDEEFVCRIPFQLHPVKHIVLPAIISVTSFIAVVTLMILMYAYKHELKVILFVYTGWHPFDKQRDCKEIRVDVTIVHSKADTDWLIENAMDVLELHNYRVVLSGRDFLAGISFQENLRRFMKISQRLIICVSQTLLTDHEWFDIAWDFAVHKIKRTQTNFAIVINRDLPKQHLRDKDLKFYIRSNKYIDFRKMLFQAKLLYNMPRSQVQINREEMIEMNDEIINVFNSDACDLGDVRQRSAFISYEDEDVGYVVRQLAPLLEDRGFKLYLPDWDFQLGVPHADNISEAIENSGHTVFILSEYGVMSEWHRFAFAQARDRTFSSDATCNHLIMILRGKVDIDKLTEDLRQYIKSVITLSTDDRWFHQKLYNALRISVGQQRMDRDDQENDPLIDNN